MVWSCGKDDESAPEVRYAVLDFENATAVAGPTAYGDNLYSTYEGVKYTGYTDVATGLSMGLNIDEGESWSSGQPEFYSGGIAPSRWHDMETNDFTNQCSVYGTGGNGGSATFGIVYAPVDLDGTPRPAKMKFADGVERIIESLWIANSTYTALSGVGEFVLVIEGFDAAGESVGTEQCELTGLTDWHKVGLSGLGMVNRIEFTIDCPALMAPTYVCIDDIKVVVG